MPRAFARRPASPLVVALWAIGLVALVSAGALVGYARSPKVGTYPSSERPAPAIASVLPLYENCGMSAEFEPRVVRTCGSPCAAGLSGIVWTTWTSAEAIGVGTFSSNLHQRDCSDPRVAPRLGPPHPGVRIVLRDPEERTFCALSVRNVFVANRAVIFTGTNVLPSLDLIQPVCPSPQALEK